ncbi:MAG: 16S rRNA (uracil(1498)-N(3))-methyltransferase [Hominimerdicola sp.]
MPRFFTDKNNIGQNTINIIGQDAFHIGRSLRMRLHDEITVCCEGEEYQCEILTISDSMVECKILSHKPSENEPNIKLTLFQAVPKSDKLDFIVQKAVELGAAEICPVLTSRCVSRPDKKSCAKKLDRLNKIALEAAKQSGRGIIPTVTEIISFDECVKRMSKFDFPLMCYEKGGKQLAETGLKDNSTVAVFIGSEGGFSPEEAEIAVNSGIIPIGLGNRILRCETAPISAISIIMNLTGNM